MTIQFRIGEIVRTNTNRIVFSGRIINIKKVDYPFGKPIILYQIQDSDGLKEWINEIYLYKIR